MGYPIECLGCVIVRNDPDGVSDKTSREQNHLPPKHVHNPASSIDESDYFVSKLNPPLTVFTSVTRFVLLQYDFNITSIYHFDNAVLVIKYCFLTFSTYSYILYTCFASLITHFLQIPLCI